MGEDGLFRTSKGEGRTSTPFSTGGGGPAAGSSFVWTQSLPAAVWNINHGLGYYPGGIIVEDSVPELIQGGEVSYVDTNNITITFAFAFGGKAYIS